MKSGVKISVLFTAIVLVMAIILQMTQKEEIDWKKSYNPNKKAPYGTYILKRELPNILKDSPKITDITQPLYEFLTSERDDASAVIFYISNQFNLGEAAEEKLLNYVDNGGSLFISTLWLSKYFRDSLNMGTGYHYSSTRFLNKDTIHNIQLYSSDISASYDKIIESRSFNRLPKDDVTLLGGFGDDKEQNPNFIQYKYGKGTIFVHLEPDVFTNYYLLQQDNYSVAWHTLQYLNGKDILWYDDYHSYDASQTPLRYILSQPALKAAWYTLLIALVLLLVFRSKRHQRAIPIVIPEPNLSVEFAKTIGSLYYENGSPGDMIDKKIDYLLYDIRKQFQLETRDLSDKKLIVGLSRRAQIPENEVAEFLNELIQVREKAEPNTGDLKSIYQQIENFRQKSNMI